MVLIGFALPIRWQQAREAFFPFEEPPASRKIKAAALFQSNSRGSKLKQPSLRDNLCLKLLRLLRLYPL